MHEIYGCYLFHYKKHLSDNFFLINWMNLLKAIVVLGSSSDVKFKWDISNWEQSTFYDSGIPPAGKDQALFYFHLQSFST